jgi:hypothetical protein
MSEKIIEKIKKALALAANNPSEEEAKSAALKAQELMAKYGIAQADIDDITEQEIEKIEEVQVNVGAAKAWKFYLADVIARNFRCRTFFYGRRIVVFYGYSTDAQIAAETFKFLFAIGHKLADREMRKTLRWYHSKGLSAQVAGIYNSFTAGFCNGIAEVLDKQCTALMIVMAQEVKESYELRSANFKQANLGAKLDSNFDYEVYQKGIQSGRNTMSARSIEGGK